MRNRRWGKRHASVHRQLDGRIAGRGSRCPHSSVALAREGAHRRASLLDRSPPPLVGHRLDHPPGPQLVKATEGQTFRQCEVPERPCPDFRT
jgi:hypothetical protein